jgi:hypothetical protein
MLRFFYVNTTMVCACCVLPIVCMEARSFASFTNITYIVHIYICVVGMEAKHFASCCPLSVWKREVSFLLLTQRILYIYMCCGNGSETFRLLLPIVCMEARGFASFTNTTYIVHIYVLWEWKRNISLLVAPHWLCGSEKFRFFY